MVETGIESLKVLLVIVDIYPHRFSGGCGGSHSTQGGGHGGPPDDSSRAGSGSSCSSEFRRWYRHDWWFQ